MLGSCHRVEVAATYLNAPNLFAISPRRGQTSVTITNTITNDRITSTENVFEFRTNYKDYTCAKKKTKKSSKTPGRCHLVEAATTHLSAQNLFAISPRVRVLKVSIKRGFSSIEQNPFQTIPKLVNLVD